MIVQTIGLVEFHEAFRRMGRHDQFTTQALDRLFEHYDSFSEMVELDVIGICCAWSEYEDIDEACENLGVDDLDELQRHADTLSLDCGGILVRDF